MGKSARAKNARPRVPETRKQVVIKEEPPRALLAVPTRGYVWHETAMQIQNYKPVYYREKLSVASVRNKIARDFLENKHGGPHDLLFMIDDDVIPPVPNWADAMVGLPYDIVGLPVPMSKMPDLPVILNCFNESPDGNWLTAQAKFIEGPGAHIAVDAVGTGVMMIRRHVLEHPDMKLPFNQLLDSDGTIQVGQDINFCIRAKKAGFTIGVSCDVICDHFVNLHLNSIPFVYGTPNPTPSQIMEPEESSV